MAPIRSKSGGKKALSGNQNRPPPAAASGTFPTTKKDKRLIKHSAFVSKIEKSRKKPLRRRRTSKKLVADLNSLAEALPSGEPGDEVTTHAINENTQVNVIKHKSLKHKPGAMKRKEKLDKLERGRFAKNMTQLAAGLQTGNIDQTQAEDNSMNNNCEASSTSARWAALRSFISQTMDQNPEFKQGNTL
ncbi:hypothetical protein FQN57_001960 [Myotisia sp. PD_48]|nr:hypothetical protein FQN57_001960 [Myotisia sp. PD_48]